MYSGDVNIKVYENKELINTINTRNHGSINLCHFLRDALMGKVVSSKRPFILVPCYKQGSSLKNINNNGSVLSSYEIIDKFEDNPDISAIKLKFIVKDVLNTVWNYAVEYFDKKWIEGFKIYSQSGYSDSDLLCEIDLRGIVSDIPDIRNSKSIPVSKSTDLEVEWIMRISCNTGDSNE